MPCLPSTPAASSHLTSRVAPGISEAYQGDSFAVKALIVFGSGLSMYNAVELIILAFMTFAHYHSLYFWSFLISSIGIIPYSLGLLFKSLGVLRSIQSSAKWGSLVLISVGWVAMVTGQSVVLWSRLHLIVSGEHGQKILLYTKRMIIVNAVVLHTTTIVVEFGAFGTIDTGRFAKAYDIVEKIQVTGFFLQETILSSIYIVETIRILQGSLRQKTRAVMRQLLIINVIVIIMDMALLGMQYASLFLLQTISKGVFYSIKLKLELAILSRLVKFVRRSSEDFIEMPSTSASSQGGR
ncbi:hypothetical protein V493_04328 [Pseudogymnoascus sp. VKM F-4281 (FW-2241)]|nr:hypothetical protein V493_04328 [Pseudogymnoascus sp. VKM F-4281 (FW-2241)]